MLFYGKPSQYAIRALIYIAENPDAPSLAKDIADRENMPKHFLSKVLKDLVGARILDSRLGPGGGFWMKKSVDKITLLQIVRIFEDIDTSLKTCAIGWAKCSDHSPCGLHHEFKCVRQKVHDYLNTTTLESLLSADKDKRS